MWDQVSGATNGDNILLVTQCDKLKNELERARVMKRLKAETGDRFQQIFPISLLQAIEAGDDFSIWEQSGAAEFIEQLLTLIMKPPHAAADRQADGQERTECLSSSLIVEHVAEVVQEDPSIQDMQKADDLDGGNVDRIRPKRVRIKTRIKPRTPRPQSKAVGIG